MRPAKRKEYSSLLTSLCSEKESSTTKGTAIHFVGILITGLTLTNQTWCIARRTLLEELLVASMDLILLAGELLLPASAEIVLLADDESFESDLWV